MKKQNMREMLARLNREDGQGMTEYIIIVALIAVAAIGIVTVFGRQIQSVFDSSTGALTGENIVNTSRRVTGVQNKNLSNFNQRGEAQ